MKLVLALAGIVCLTAQPAIAGGPHKRDMLTNLKVYALLESFDLSEIGADGLPAARNEEVATTRIDPPRGMDTHKNAWTPPSFEVPLLQDGPVLAMGAMGSRKKGMPKLAHVVVDWDF